MADISSITLPNGDSYNFKDTTARTNTKNIWYGTCSTGGSTAAKVVTTNTGDFVCNTGNMVRVKFTSGSNTNTATLKVDDETAHSICTVGSIKSPRYYWVDGEVVDFVFDGTNFVMSNKGTATTSYYGLTKLSSSTSSTSTTLAATASAVKSAYDLASSKQNAVTYSTTDLTPGTSSLTTGDIYVVYE